MFDAASVMHGYIHEGIAAVVLSVVGWILVFPVRTFFNAIKNAWNTQANTLKDIHKELGEERVKYLAEQVKLLAEVKKELEVERASALAGMVASTERQVELLEKVAEILDKIHTSQSEMSGFMKGSHRGE